MVRPSRQRTAAAVVELAVVIPVILVIFYALIEISRLLLLQHTADAAAYEGARHAMVPGATSSDAIAAANVLLQADGLKGTTIKVEPAEITEATSVITVEVLIPAAQNSWLRFFQLNGLLISGRISLYCERPPIALLTGISEMKSKAKKVKADTDDDDL